jgi:hypothetical protein
VLDGGYFSYQDAFSPTNFIAVAPNFTLSLLTSVSLTVEAQRVWRAKGDDAVYAASGRAYTGTQSVRGTHVADVAACKPSGRSRRGFDNSDCLSGWISLKL